MKFVKLVKSATNITILNVISNLAEKFDELAIQSKLFFNKGTQFNDTQLESLEKSVKIIMDEIEHIKGIFMTNI